jgi:hypothetical protein
MLLVRRYQTLPRDIASDKLLQYRMAGFPVNYRAVILPGDNLWVFYQF